MATLETTITTIQAPERDCPFEEAQLAAMAFLARYSGRTLDAYRHDLRSFFQWAADNQLAILQATRPHIELYRAAMEERRLAPSTIDRRLFDGVRLLPVRSHRWPHSFESSPICASTQGAAE